MFRSFLGLTTLVFVVIIHSTPLSATQYTPLTWQKKVVKHANAALVGQRKHLTWVRDQNRNFIDDEIERRFHPGDTVNIIVDLNRCTSPSKIREDFARYGQVTYRTIFYGDDRYLSREEILRIIRKQVEALRKTARWLNASRRFDTNLRFVAGETRTRAHALLSDLLKGRRRRQRNWEEKLSAAEALCANLLDNKGAAIAISLNRNSYKDNRYRQHYFTIELLELLGEQDWIQIKRGLRACCCSRTNFLTVTSISTTVESEGVNTLVLV